jgi:hypothetical protein
MDAEQQHRAARRKFIRAHHPDRGGDAAEFIAGLAHLEHLPPGRPEHENLVEFEDQEWPRSLVSVLIRRLRRHAN